MNQSRPLQQILIGVLVICLAGWISWVTRSAIANAKAIAEITRDISYLKGVEK